MGEVRRAAMGAAYGRRQWTEDDARRVIAAWEASGESLASFARSTGLLPQRLYRWRQRLAGETAIERVPSYPSGSPTGFLPVEVLAPADRGGKPALVVGGDGLRLEIEDVGLVPPAWIAELVIALRERRS